MRSILAARNFPGIYAISGNCCHSWTLPGSTRNIRIEVKASMTATNLKSGNARSRSFALAMVFAALLMWTLQAQIPNPIQAAKDAVNKAKQQNNAAAPSSRSGAPAANNSVNAANKDGAINPPAGTKIEATLLSPPLPGAGFVVSPLGIHMATLAHSGSRSVVIYDNVEGPKFDQIMGGNALAAFAFSSDGSHFAYCEQQGNAVVVMEDGKEIWRAEVEGGISGGNCGAGDMHFTSNSKHLYFLASTRIAVGPQKYDAASFVFDGQANPPGALAGLPSISFSPDGDHYAYLWTDASTASRRGDQQIVKLIVDGKPAPYLAGPMQWSTDSKHLFSMTRGSGAVDLLLDGKPIAHANDLRLFIPPTGDMTAFLITRTAPPPGGVLLAINNKPVPGGEVPNGQGGIQSVIFSKDGKHYAAQYENASHQKFVLWDGKKGLTYRNLIAFKGREEHDARYFDFTPDGRVIYLADDPGANQYLVIGDKESDQIRATTEVVVSATGHVMANSASNATFGAGINLDGKYLQIPYGIATWYLGFSPDGNHYAFVLQTRDSPVLFLDGAAQPNTVYVPNATNTAFAFSPDSKHFAYFYRTANDMGVCLDGKCVSGGNGNNYFNLTFSADSNHLFWVSNSPRAFRLFVDGKPVLESGAPAFQSFPKETWQTSGPSGMILLAHDNEGYKRISITPSPQSSLATLR